MTRGERFAVPGRERRIVKAASGFGDTPRLLMNDQHLTDFTLDEVTVLKRNPRTRYQSQTTDFSLRAAGLVVHRVEIAGWPHLEAGHTITALCRTPGQLQSVVGWQNQTTGEVALLTAERQSLQAILLTVVCVLTWLRPGPPSLPGLRGLELLGTAFATLWTLGLVRFCWRVRRERALLRSVPNRRLMSDVGKREPL